MTTHSDAQGAAERIREAVRIIREDEGDLRERLDVAFVSQLWEIDPASLPKPAADILARLRILITQDQVVGDTGNAGHQLKKMSDEQLHEIEHQIFELEKKVESN